MKIFFFSLFVILISSICFGKNIALTGFIRANNNGEYFFKPQKKYLNSKTVLIQNNNQIDLKKNLNLFVQIEGEIIQCQPRKDCLRVKKMIPAVFNPLEL